MFTDARMGDIPMMIGQKDLEERMLKLLEAVTFLVPKHKFTQRLRVLLALLLPELDGIVWGLFQESAACARETTAAAAAGAGGVGATTAAAAAATAAGASPATAAAAAAAAASDALPDRSSSSSGGRHGSGMRSSSSSSSRGRHGAGMQSNSSSSSTHVSRSSHANESNGNGGSWGTPNSSCCSGSKRPHMENIDIDLFSAYAKSVNAHLPADVRLVLAGLVLGSQLSLDAAALVWRFLVEAEQSGGPAWEEDVPLQVVMMLQEAQGLWQAALQYMFNLWVVHLRGVEAMGLMQEMREEEVLKQQQQQQQQEGQDHQQRQQQQQQQAGQGTANDAQLTSLLMLSPADVLPVMEKLKERVRRDEADSDLAIKQ